MPILNGQFLNWNIRVICFNSLITAKVQLKSQNSRIIIISWTSFRWFLQIHCYFPDWICYSPTLLLFFIKWFQFYSFYNWLIVDDKFKPFALLFVCKGRRRWSGSSFVGLLFTLVSLVSFWQWNYLHINEGNCIIVIHFFNLILFRTI